MPFSSFSESVRVGRSDSQHLALNPGLVRVRVPRPGGELSDNVALVWARSGLPDGAFRLAVRSFRRVGGSHDKNPIVGGWYGRSPTASVRLQVPDHQPGDGPRQQYSVSISRRLSYRFTQSICLPVRYGNAQFREPSWSSSLATLLRRSSRWRRAVARTTGRDGFQRWATRSD